MPKLEKLTQIAKQNPNNLPKYVKEIKQLALANLECLLSRLNVEFYSNGERISGKCPIHCGDNASALCIYLDSGNWYCWTHHCEEEHRGIINFFSALLEYNFVNTLLWIVRNVKKEYIIPETKPKKNDAKPDIMLIKNLVIPPNYYLNRGIRADILIKYGVGLALTGKLKNRVVFPIHNIKNEFVGCTSRTICPVTKSNKKWLHDGIKTSFHLYNINHAKNKIEQTKRVYLVESTMNTLKLVQNGIENVVCCFGAQLTQQQSILLECCDAQTIIPIFDNDEAGQLATKRAQKYEQFKFELDALDFNGYNDVGDMPDELIKEQLC